MTIICAYKKVLGGIIERFKANTKDVIIFKGIPYTAPPIGDLRQKSPQNVNSWKGIRECKTQKQNSIQPEITIRPDDVNSESYQDPTV